MPPSSFLPSSSSASASLLRRRLGASSASSLPRQYHRPWLVAAATSTPSAAAGRRRPRPCWAAGAVRAFSSPSSESNPARDEFYRQLGFKTIVRDRLEAAREEIRRGLGSGGEGYVVLKDFLRDPDEDKEEHSGGGRLCRDMRAEAAALFKAGLFYASFAYRGEERVEKLNVFNYELEGYEWDYTPSLLMYTREIMLHVPPLLNALFPKSLRISHRAYANKIAVSTGGGSHYLKHTDNNTPGDADQRRVTLVYYLNPGWDAASNGGQLRLSTRTGKQVDVPPEGDTLVVFFSDELAHEVLPNHDEREEHHRITYTLWLVDEGLVGPAEAGKP